jgi:hypothetical protein
MEIKPNEIAEAMQKSFDRKQIYPTISVKGLRDALELLPEEYDDTDVAFGFLLKDMGDSGNNDGMKNFILGTIPIKCLVRHPDQTKVMVCDDACTEYFTEFCNSQKKYLNEPQV